MTAPRNEPQASEPLGEVPEWAGLKWLQDHIAEVDDDNSYWGGPHKREYLSAPEILKELRARLPAAAVAAIEGEWHDLV